jgi:hypothetical protein
MRTLSPTALAALSARNVTVRDFIWIEAKTRDTRAVFSKGFWSDVGTVYAQVEDPRTGVNTSRQFTGAGGLIQISPIIMAANLSVQTVNVTLSQIADPSTLARAYDLKFARIEIFRGLFSPGTLLQLSPAFPRFVGFVDGAPITTPGEGGDGSIELTCVGHSQEMGRLNTATRSDADVRNRSSSDTFGRHTASVGTWEINWGKGMTAPQPKRKKFLGIF